MMKNMSDLEIVIAALRAEQTGLNQRGPGWTPNMGSLADRIERLQKKREEENAQAT